jgi:membrane protein implicated in regulation of membrane protease activity
MLAGALFVLCLARLRMLVLLTALVAAPALFIADRASLDPAAAGAVTWPALLVCAAILGYASTGIVRPALERHGSRLAGMRARVRNRRALGDAATPAERPDA